MNCEQLKNLQAERDALKANLEAARAHRDALLVRQDHLIAEVQAEANLRRQYSGAIDKIMEGKMNIDDLTVGQVKELVGLVKGKACDNSAWEIGENYLIRTVTMIQTGRLVAVTDRELVIEDAAWIADTGKFANALATGDFSEVEPFPAGRVIVGRGAVIDAVKIKSLPRSVK